MSAISYPRAALSFLPLVGGWIGTYNVFDAIDEATDNVKSSAKKTDELQSKMDHVNMRIRRMGRSENPQEEINNLEQTVLDIKTAAIEEKRKPDQYRSILLEKVQVYTLCGIVGDILTMVTVVSAVALGVFAASELFVTSMLATSCISIAIKVAFWYITPDSTPKNRQPT